MKKLLSILLCVALLLGVTPAGSVYASVTWPSDVSIAAEGGIVMDANSGTVLYGKNIHEAYYPASITKILTALVIIKNCDLDDIVTFTHSAVNTLEPGSSILGARVNDQMSVRDCLYALLLQSANEVANALAEHCSGSIEAFAELMNKEAQSLGCTDSNFANPSGLNNENHYTSAHDMALIAKAAFSDPTFVEIDSTLYYDVPAGQLQQYPDGWRYYAHHRMMKKNDSNYYSGIIGGKTGYTSLAGNTLVTCAERDGMKLIAVVLNGHQTHYSDTKALLDFGFDNFKSVAIADKDSTYQKIENDLSIGGIFPSETTKLSVNQNSVITLPTEADFSDVTSTLDYDLDNSAPDSAVARIDYMYGEKIVGQAWLEASTVPGYVPSVSQNTTDSSSEHASAQESDIQDNGLAANSASVSNITAERTPEEETFPLFNQTKEAEEPAEETSSLFSTLKKVLIGAAVIGVIGAAICGILIYRERQEERERMIRREKRERRMKDWGYSSTEFDMIMQEHLRSKNQFKKRGFLDQIKDFVRRR
ncbi:MAG: D-alanyl-D-alanine carboxypeptidase [Lachnospiraceae bacterium]|nr:D-alanyl-D-alanine carboxypeptidase [Lachnospiraceae bacterium]